MDAVRDERLVDAAQACALRRRLPHPGLLQQSDRGAQYTSAAYQTVLAQHGIELSMSRTANCWDTALMESFFGTVKLECVDRQHFTTRAQATTAIFAYLEVCSNRQRLHLSLGYQTPVAFEHAGPTAALPTP